jgi:hypothetical protein
VRDADLNAPIVPQTPRNNGQGADPNVPRRPRNNQASQSHDQVIYGRVSRPKAKKQPKQPKPMEMKEPKPNFVPLSFNRLGDRVFKEPTPEREREDHLGLEAWKARASMSMAPTPALALQPVPALAPQAPFGMYEESKPAPVPSLMYYGESSKENGMDGYLPDSRDDHARFYKYD